MQESLPTALAITAIGMTLLFLALGLFYGLLTLVMAVVRDRGDTGHDVAETTAVDTIRVVSEDAGDARQRAAAVAVALARAEAEAGAGRAAGSSHAEDAARAGGWWALHHGQRLAAPPSPWRGR